MAKPIPEPVNPGQLVNLAKAVVQADPLLRQYLGSLDNPELIVYRIRPTRVRYMKEWSLEYHEVPLEN